MNHKHPFKATLSRSDLIEYVVLDIELRDPSRRGGGHGGWSQLAPAAASSDEPAKCRRGGWERAVTAAWGCAAGRLRRGRDYWALAGSPSPGRLWRRPQSVAVTHPHLLKPGDHAWGYAVAASGLFQELDAEQAERLPEVMLVKKSFSERRGTKAHRRRLWKLRMLEKERDAGVQRGRQMDTTSYEEQLEEFMQELEEDPSMRQQINLYKDEDAAARPSARPPSPQNASEPPRDSRRERSSSSRRL